MAKITETIQEVVQRFDNLITVFYRDGWKLAKNIADNYILEIQVQYIIDTGRFLRSIGWREQVHAADDHFQQYFIDSSRDYFVTYDGFIEGGTKFMPARYPAQKGIERTDFELHIDSLVETSLGK